jgi:hypothetical protein
MGPVILEDTAPAHYSGRVVRIALGLGLIVLAGCAGGAAERAPSAATPSTPAPAELADDLPALLATLPVGADRCVVARPTSLDAQHRALAARIAQAEPLVWLPQLQVSGYASVERAGRDGPSAAVSVLVTALPEAEARAAIDRDSPDAIDWSATPAPCIDAGCPLRARFVAPHWLRIERGVFTASREPGVEGVCRQQAQQRPALIESTAARESAARALDLSGLPGRTTTELRTRGAGLRVQRVDRWESPVEAEAAFQEQATTGLLLGAALSGLGEVRRERRGDALYTEVDVAWEDLELARDDDARMKDAEQRTAALLQVRPDLDTVLRDRDELLGAVGYLLDDARRSGDVQRGRDLQIARALLERGLTEDADDARIGLVLCELLVGELHEAEPAAQLVGRFIAQRADDARLRACGRGAAALISSEALERRLVEDGVVPRRGARNAAREIASRVHDGMAYDSAERAVLGAPR